MVFRIALIFTLLGATDSNTLADVVTDVAQASTISAVPLTKTPATQLDTDKLKHYEVLRIKRDFGKDSREIVLDAWMPRRGPKELSEVRLWWVEEAEDDLRKPFGKKTRKVVHVDYDQRNDGSWEVAFGAMGKMYPFVVELDDRDRPVVYADIETKSGERIDRCRANRTRLFARKLLDKAVGLKKLSVRCKDADGKTHNGTLRPRGA